MQQGVKCVGNRIEKAVKRFRKKYCENKSGAALRNCLVSVVKDFWLASGRHDEKSAETSILRILIVTGEDKD